MNICLIGDSISLSDASRLTQNYRNNNPNLALADLYGRGVLVSILDLSTYEGKRMSNAQNKKLIIVSVDAQGNDLTDGNMVNIIRPYPTLFTKKNPHNN
jgi:hypothetical protein